MAVTVLENIPIEWFRTTSKTELFLADIVPRNPNQIAIRIGKDVAKLRSCSAAGRAWIAGNRCEAAGIFKDGAVRIRLPARDPHLRPKHTPIGTKNVPSTRTIYDYASIMTTEAIIKPHKGYPR